MDSQSKKGSKSSLRDSKTKDPNDDSRLSNENEIKSDQNVNEKSSSTQNEPRKDVNVTETKSKNATSASSENTKGDSSAIRDEKTNTKTIADEKSPKKTTKESDKVISDSKEVRVLRLDFPFSKLPDDIVKVIFSFLDPLTVIYNSCVCKQWQRIVSHMTITSLNFNLRHSALTRSTLKKICKKYSTLTLLSLTSCYNVNEKGLRSIAKYLTNLSTLYLDSMSSISKDGFRYINRIPTLTELQIARTNSLDETGIRAISSLPNLVKLDLSGCISLTNKTLSPISTLTNLTFLNISSCPAIDNGVLDTIIFLPKLKSLILNWNEIDDDGVKTLITQKISHSPTSTNKQQENSTQLRGLEETLQCLYLVGTEVKDRSVKRICKHFTNLHQLSLAWCCDVTNKGMKHLTRLKSLEFLDLECTKIDGVIWTMLSELPQLKQLNISNTQFSEADQRSLKEKKPNIKFLQSFFP